MYINNRKKENIVFNKKGSGNKGKSAILCILKKEGNYLGIFIKGGEPYDQCNTYCEDLWYLFCHHLETRYGIAYLYILKCLKIDVPLRTK